MKNSIQVELYLTLDQFGRVTSKWSFEIEDEKAIEKAYDVICKILDNSIEVKHK